MFLLVIFMNFNDGIRYINLFEMEQNKTKITRQADCTCKVGISHFTLYF